MIDQRESEEERQGPWTMLLSWVASFNYLVSLQIKFSPTLMTYEHPWFFKLSLHSHLFEQNKMLFGLNYYFVTFKRQKSHCRRIHLHVFSITFFLKFYFVEAQVYYHKIDFDTKQINKIHLGMNFIFTDIYVIIHKYMYKIT